MATSHVFEEQREVRRRCAKATSGTNQEKPTQMHRSKNLSYNRKVGTTTEKHLMTVHEKTIHALNLRRIKMMDEV